MATVYGFNEEKDIDRVLRMLDSFERSKGRSVSGPNGVRTEARYAKILTLIEVPEAEEGEPNIKDKQATGVEAVWDSDAYDFTVVAENPVMYDDILLQESDATVFSTNNISSKTAMKVGQVVLLQKYPHLSDTSGWLVVETGGSSRAYVIITEFTDPANYTGNLLTGPDDDTVIKEGITIRITGATANELAAGYADFADVVDDTYYLDGTLLG